MIFLSLVKSTCIGTLLGLSHKSFFGQYKLSQNLKKQTLESIGFMSVAWMPHVSHPCAAF